MLVEGEGADVAVFVLFLLVQPLFEVTVFLETVLLGHLSLLVLVFHCAAFAAELAHLAVEHLVFAELTFQRTVVERDLDTGLQSNLLEALLAIAQNPGIAPRELMLQSFANHAIGTQQVGCRYTFTIRRVGHHDALLVRLRKVLEVLLFDGDVGCQPGSLHVHASGVHRLHVNIVAVDVVLEFAFLRIVVVDAVEEVGIEVRPFLEGILLAEQARCHVVSNEGGFDEQRATAAHGVNEVGIAFPSCHENHACGQHLVERCFHALLTIATTMQTFAAGVQTQRAVVLGYVNVQAQVGVADGDVGPAACFLAELVDDGVFHLVADELGVAELLREHHGVDRKGAVVI